SRRLSCSGLSFCRFILLGLSDGLDLRAGIGSGQGLVERRTRIVQLVGVEISLAETEPGRWVLGGADGERLFIIRDGVVVFLAEGGGHAHGLISLSLHV